VLQFVGYFSNLGTSQTAPRHTLQAQDLSARLLHSHLTASNREKILSVTVLLVLLGSSSSLLGSTRSRELLLLTEVELFDG